MLGVNNKQSVTCPIAEALQAYIDSNYSKDEAEAVRQKVLDVERLRDTMVKTLSKSEVTVNDLKMLESYNQTLQLVTSRFPFGDMKKTGGGWFSKAKVGSVKVTFTYSEAFKEKKKANQFDDQFELACVAFNIAAVSSQVALTLKKQDDLKEACGMYRSSAGIFSSIANNSNYTNFGSITVDLQKNTLDFFSAVMLAQAQGCFVEMAISQKKSAELVSKLAQGASGMFKSASTLVTGEFKDMLNRHDYPWVRHLQHQQHCFLASALFFRSKVSLEKAEEGEHKEYGVEVAYLQAANKAILDATKLSSHLNLATIHARNALEEMVTDRLRKATKENDMIYFALVPKLDGISDIEGKVVVTPIVPAWAATPGQPPTPQAFEDDPFAKLVPAKVHEDAKMFEGRVGETIQRLGNEAREDTARQNAILASMGLPASLQVLNKDTGLPPKVWSDVRETQLKGGVRAIAELQDRVAQASNSCTQLFNEIKMKLSEEQKDDEEMRARFGIRWNRRPSPEITADLMKAIDTIEGFLRGAKDADDKIAREWQQNFDKMALMEQGKEEIESKMPQAPKAQETEKTQVIATLEAMMVTSNDLIARRESAVRQLSQTASKLNIIGLLMAKDSKLKTFEQLCNEGLQPLRPIEASLQEMRETQAELLRQIQEVNETFVRTRQTDPSMEARQMVLQSLNTSVECWNRLMKNLNEGLKFYLELCSTKLEPLRQNVEDYKVARDMEKTTLLGQLSHEFARQGAATGSGAASNPNIYGASSNPAYNLPQTPLPGSGGGHRPGAYQDFQQSTFVTYHPPPQTSYSSASSFPQPLGSPPPSNNPLNLPQQQLYSPQPQQQQQHFPQQQQQQQYYQPQQQPQQQQQSRGYTSTNPFASHLSQSGANPYAAAPNYSLNPFGPPPSKSSPSPSPSPYGVPVASPAQNQWACSACTYLNNANAKQCSMCGSSKQ